MTTIAILHPFMVSDTCGVVLDMRTPTITPMIKHQVSACRRFAYGIPGLIDDATQTRIEPIIAALIATDYSEPADAAQQTALLLLDYEAIIGKEGFLAMTRERIYRAIFYRDRPARFKRCEIGHPLAVGSGAEFFHAGIVLGMDIIQAMEHTTKLDRVTRGPLTTTRADELAPFTVA